MNIKKSSPCVAAGIVALLLASGAAPVSAQTDTKDPYEGTWVLNPALSWQFRGEQNKYEIIRITVEDGVQTYRVRSMGPRGRPSTRTRATA